MKNKKIVIGMGTFLLVASLFTTGCGKEVKLSSKAVVGIENGEVTVNDFYKEIKKDNISRLIDMIDHKILDEKYKKSSEEDEEVKKQITSGSAECAFVMDGADSYTYYVNNLSMYDSNTEIANTVLQEVYRVTAMVQYGMTPEQADNIMSTQIESHTTTLGKDQMQNFFHVEYRVFSSQIPYLLLCCTPSERLHTALLFPYHRALLYQNP